MSLPGLSGLLKRSLAALRRPFGTTSTGGGWGSGVERVAEDLENLNRSTERDFLAVGEKLMEFRSTARRIASDMADLTELISGEQGRKVSHALNGTLEHSREMDARIGRSGQALGRVAGLSSDIRQVFAGLHRTVSVFRALCTLTRIETSRLGGAGAGFGDLATEVRPLSEAIQSSGEGVLEASVRLDQGVQSAIRRVSDLRARQLKELPEVIAGVMEGLRSFDERQARAVETSARQAVQYQALCGAVDDMVESVQFHDITRQQIEHVAQALRHLRSEHDPGRSSFPPNARAILTLQCSQLSGAAGIFAASVERLQRDLESIAGRVLEMAEASRALMGVSADDQDSFFLRMEGRLTAILKMLDICSAAQAEMGHTSASLEESVARMRESVAVIREIEIRIQRIAVNAMIRATHIGAAGNALNAIAEVMQKLALESNASTEDAAGTLDAMSAAAGCVCGGVDGAALGAGEVIGEMRNAVLELHSSSERSFSHVNQIAALGAHLAEDIGAVRGGFSAGRLFAEVVGRARGELERIGAQAGQESPEGAADVPEVRLESLTRRYTMQTEREVHQSAARGLASESAVPTAASSAALADGDLGDNVELF
jgi:methyl-accepting chemotaxis protein